MKKNPFETSRPPSSGQPKPTARPRSGMVLSATSQEGIEVMGHNQAPDIYQKRIPQPDSALDVPTVKITEPRKTQQAPPPKRNEEAPPPDRRAGGLLTTASGFEIMDNDADEENYVKRFRDEHEPPPKKAETVCKQKLDTKNYMKSYREQQAAEKLEIEKKTRIEKKKEEFEERKKIDNYGARARYLQNEIAGWRQKLGQNPSADAGIQTAIDQLMLELSQIPIGYR